MIIGILGFGKVAKEVVALLAKSRFDSDRTLRINKIATRNRISKEDIPDYMVQSQFTVDGGNIVNDSEIDIVVELITDSDAAYKMVSTALENGKHVITANRQLVAKHGLRLQELSIKKGVKFLFEGSVGCGIPIIYSLKYLKGSHINSIIGILNGTSNFVLTQMHRHGAHLDQAVQRAVHKGICERDVEDDLQGIDAAEKLMILSMACFNTAVRKKDIYLGHLKDISLDDIKLVQNLGFRIKQLSSTYYMGERLFCSVSPTLVPAEHPIAVSDGIINAILINYDQTDSLSFLGKAVDAKSTSRAVFSDLLYILDTAGTRETCNVMQVGKIIGTEPYPRGKIYIRIKERHRKILQYINREYDRKDFDLQTSQGKDLIMIVNKSIHTFRPPIFDSEHLTVLPIMPAAFPCNA